MQHEYSIFVIALRGKENHVFSQGSKLGDKAEDAAGTAKDKAKGAAGKVEDKAGDAADEAKVRIRTQLCPNTQDKPKNMA